MQWVVGQLVVVDEGPDIAKCPVGNGAQLGDRLAGIHDVEGRPASRLRAPQTRYPTHMTGQRTAQWANFPDFAASQSGGFRFEYVARLGAAEKVLQLCRFRRELPHADAIALRKLIDQRDALRVQSLGIEYKDSR